MRFFNLVLALPLIGAAFAVPTPHTPTTTHKPAPAPSSHKPAPTPSAHKGSGGGLLGGINVGLKADIKLDVAVTTYLKDVKHKLVSSVHSPSSSS
jgi:hypothetical protein